MSKLHPPNSLIFFVTAFQFGHDAFRHWQSSSVVDAILFMHAASNDVAVDTIHTAIQQLIVMCFLLWDFIVSGLYGCI